MPGARSWDATDTSGDPAGALARLVASSWQLVHQFRMHAAAEDAAAGRLDADDAVGLITATLLAAFTPHQGG